MTWNGAFTAVLPVVTLILGALLNQFSDGRREAAALKREAALRQLDREAALLDRRETFELTHLVEVNDVLSRLFTAAIACFEHVQASEPLGEASNALMAGNREITRLLGLVLDDELRALVKRAHREANALSMSKTDSYTAMGEALNFLNVAQDAIGSRLRDIYGSDPRASHTPGSAERRLPQR